MGKPIDHISQEEFFQFAEQYNLGWIIAHSPESKEYFDRMPGVIPLQGFLDLQTYQIQRPLGYFLKGSGRISSRDHNQLTLSNVKGSEIILKYHYIRGLVSNPSTDIVAIKYPDDPNPFIGIRNPPSDLTLFLP